MAHTVCIQQITDIIICLVCWKVKVFKLLIKWQSLAPLFKPLVTTDYLWFGNLSLIYHIHNSRVQGDCIAPPLLILTGLLIIKITTISLCPDQVFLVSVFNVNSVIVRSRLNSRRWNTNWKLKIGVFIYFDLATTTKTMSVWSNLIIFSTFYINVGYEEESFFPWNIFLSRQDNISLGKVEQWDWFLMVQYDKAFSLLSKVNINNYDWHQK